MNISRFILRSSSFVGIIRKHSNVKLISTKIFNENLKNSNYLTTITGLTVGVFSGFVIKNRYEQIVHAASGIRPRHIPSRIVNNNRDQDGLELTLYQYQTCPFCCKVRAFLDYNGFSYNIIEVNSVFRQQIKWSDYKKVPMLIIEGSSNNYDIQLNDSSLIISTLESYLNNKSTDLNTLQTYYPVLEGEKKYGRIQFDFPNKYFLMYGDVKPNRPQKAIKKERAWRRWVDEVLVHRLSPNIYRTPSESLQAFKYFNQVGEWEKNFSYLERMVVIYVGATAMYFIGKILKRRHKLGEDVRGELYSACNEWLKIIGKEKQFFGGDEPNLADLSVYGVLTAIEGCDSFQDLMDNTNIKTWYYATKKCVLSHTSRNRLSKEETL